MRSRDHEKISAEDLERLQALLVRYYDKPYEECHRLLGKKIEGMFHGKDTNSKYIGMLTDDLGDLVSIVFLRLARINGLSVRRKGKEIENVEAMARKIVKYVYDEELKELIRHLHDRPIVEGDTEIQPLPIPQPADDEIRAITLEIMQKCYDRCVESLSANNKDIFRSYYPQRSLPHVELVELRRNLANRLAGLTREQAQSQTPAQELRRRNNLQSKVSKLRTDQVDDCMIRCVEGEVANHPHLNFLSQQ